MVTKKRSLTIEFTRILESHSIANPLLVGELVGVVEAVYTRAPRTAENKLDPRAHPFTVSYQTKVGYPLAKFAKELKWADWIFKHGYSSVQAFACYDEMKSGWWRDKKVSLSDVADKIGESVKRKTHTETSAPPVGDSPEIRARLFGGKV